MRGPIILALLGVAVGLMAEGVPPEWEKWIFWIGAAMFVGACLWGVWPYWRRVPMWPNTRLILLHEAARLAYEANRHTIGAKLEERLSKDPKSMMGTFAEMILRDEAVVIFGVYPPSKKQEQLPDEDARTFRVSADAKILYDPTNEQRRYENIAIRRKDFKRRLTEIRTEYERGRGT